MESQNEALKIIIETRIGLIKKLLDSLYETIRSSRSLMTEIETALRLYNSYIDEKIALDGILREFNESQNKKVG